MVIWRYTFTRVLELTKLCHQLQFLPTTLFNHMDPHHNVSNVDCQLALLKRISVNYVLMFSWGPKYLTPTITE